MGNDTSVAPLAERRIPKGHDFIKPAQLAHFTPAELTRRTTGLAPLIAAHAAEAERLRRPVDEVWNALRAAGFFYQFVPKAFGGMATDFDAFIDASLPIAEACASTGWVATFCAVHNTNLAHFPAETQAQIWGGDFPYVIAPQLSPLGIPAKVETVEGGVRVTGTWNWATGIVHADWIMAVAPQPRTDGSPTMIMLLFPAADAQVLDTWHADGMAGTGSHDVRVNDLFVPEHRILRDMGMLVGRGPAARIHAEPIYKTPATVLSSMAAAVPVLGAARGALKIFRERLIHRVQKGTDTQQANKAAAQLRLADADLAITAGELMLRDAGRRAYLGDIDEPNQTPLRIAVRAQMTYAVRLCRRAVNSLAEGSGSSVHMLDQPFQRIVRDVNVMASHIGFDVDIVFELHGRAMVGLPPNAFPA